MASRIWMVILSAATGACFTMLAILSVKSIIAPARRFHIASAIVAVLSILLAYLAFRAAAVADTDDEALLGSWRAGMFGAVLTLIVTITALFMFGDHTRGFLAHAISFPMSTFTTSRVLVAAVPLGFGAGLVLRMTALRRGKPSRSNVG